MVIGNHRFPEPLRYVILYDKRTPRGECGPTDDDTSFDVFKAIGDDDLSGFFCLQRNCIFLNIRPHGVLNDEF